MSCMSLTGKMIMRVMIGLGISWIEILPLLPLVRHNFMQIHYISLGRVDGR